MISTEALIGYILFIISEFISVIPIPANGLLHSFLIGFKNSFKNQGIDIKSNPNLSNLVNKIANNTNIINSLNTLLDNPGVLSHLDTINNNNKIQYIITLLSNYPQMVDNISTTVERQIVLQKQNSNQVQTSPLNGEIIDTFIDMNP